MKTINHYQFILLLFVSLNIKAQSSINKLSNNIDTKVKTLAEAFLKQTKTPGLSMAISKDGDIIYSKGFGYANIEDKITMGINTRLRTASVAKVITVTGIGRLVSEGKLNLDAPIKDYVPYIHKAYANLTARQLAGHTAGLEHRPKGNKNKQYQTIRETVELMTAPLLFKPDTDYKYSTHAFNLLAAIIEGASGKTYLQYMQEDIFKPLGMNNTVAENIKMLTQKDAKLYYVKNDKLRKERLTNGSYKIPGASFRSTPTDLVTMMHGYSNNFISKSVVEELFKSHQLKNGTQTNVGIAWRTSIDAFGHKVIEHAGNWLGARTVVIYYPEENLSVSLMVNASCQVLIEETAHMFAQVIRDESAADSTINLANTKVELTFNSQKGPKRYQGKLSFKDNQGLLESKHDGFLKSNPIYYLGNGDDYVLATAYGLLYMSFNNKETPQGQLYTYYNRQSINPRDEKPLVLFKSIN